MNFDRQYLTVRLNYFVLLAIRLTLVIGCCYFFLTSYNWMIYEKYQIGAALEIQNETAASADLNRVVNLSKDYQQFWVNAELRYYNTMGIICLVLAVASFWFVGEQDFKERQSRRLV